MRASLLTFVKFYGLVSWEPLLKIRVGLCDKLAETLPYFRPLLLIEK